MMCGQHRRCQRACAPAAPRGCSMRWTRVHVRGFLARVRLRPRHSRRGGTVYARRERLRTDAIGRNLQPLGGFAALPSARPGRGGRRRNRTGIARAGVSTTSSCGQFRSAPKRSECRSMCTRLVHHSLRWTCSTRERSLGSHRTVGHPRLGMTHRNPRYTCSG
jgi:hypothetical protein